MNLNEALSPLPAQAQVLKRLSETRAAGANMALVVMATGLGKTYASAWDVAESARSWAKPDLRVLVLSHRVDLNRQLAGAFKTVLQLSDSEITFRLPRKGRLEWPQFCFATFQSAANSISGLDPTAFDYVIVDEAHHSQAASYARVIAHLKPQFLLGLTATPERSDGLFIEKWFGPAVANIDLTYALANNYLSPVDYQLIGDELVKSGRISFAGTEVEIDAVDKCDVIIPQRDSEMLRDAVARLNERGASSCLFFCSNIAEAERIACELPGAVALHSQSLDRDQILTAFRAGRIRFVTTVDIFNEGIDVPCLDAVVFLRRTKSLTIFLQQLGRGLRLHPTKSSVTVLDYANNLRRLVLDSGRPFVPAGRSSPGSTRGPKEPELLLGVSDFEFVAQTIPLLDMLQHARSTWTADRVLLALTALAKQLERVPTRTDIAGAAEQNPFMPLWTTVTKLWPRKPTLDTAIRAELTTSAHRDTDRPDKDFILGEGFKFAVGLGRLPLRKELQAASRSGILPQWEAISEAFGSIAQFDAAITASFLVHKPSTSLDIRDSRK